MDATSVVEAALNNIAYLFPWRVVYSYERGVKFRKGRDIAELGAGIHWFWPGFEKIEIVAIAPETRNLPTQTAYTKDGKLVTFSGNVCYKIVDARKMFTSVQDFDASMIAYSMTHLADFVATKTLMELRRDREDVEREITETMSVKVAEWGAEMDWVGFTDIAQAQVYRLYSDGISL